MAVVFRCILARMLGKQTSAVDAVAEAQQLEQAIVRSIKARHGDGVCYVAALLARNGFHALLGPTSAAR